MRTYRSIRSLNVRRGLPAGFAFLPVVPTVGMMKAALDRGGVMRPGDRLGDYLRPDPDGGEPRSVAPSLVERFGARDGFAMAVLADAWSGCVAGLDEWARRRAVEGCSQFVESWLRYVPDRCPADGWPERETDVTVGHVDLAKSAEPAALPPSARVWTGAEARTARFCHVRCSAIMALRGRQADTTAALFSTVEDCLDMDRFPFVPGYSRTHRFDEDERAALLVSAMWSAASAAFLSGAEDEAFPLAASGHAALLTRACRDVPDWVGADVRYHFDAPYRGVTVEADGAAFTATSDARGVRMRARLDDGLSLDLDGIDLRVPWDERAFSTALEKVATLPGAKMTLERADG